MEIPVFSPSGLRPSWDIQAETDKDPVNCQWWAVRSHEIFATESYLHSKDCEENGVLYRSESVFVD